MYIALGLLIYVLAVVFITAVAGGNNDKGG